MVSRDHLDMQSAEAVAHRTAHWNSPMRLSQMRDSSAPQVASVSTPSFRMRAFRGVFLSAQSIHSCHRDAWLGMFNGVVDAAPQLMCAVMIIMHAVMVHVNDF